MKKIVSLIILLSFVIMNSCATTSNVSTNVSTDMSKTSNVSTNISVSTEISSAVPIESTFSVLSIESSPDADIYIDGEFAGKGVVSNRKVKHKETHNVVVKNVGFKTQSFTLRPDGKIESQ